ncbi:unnamed protein product [Sphagnum balticum]
MIYAAGLLIVTKDKKVLFLKRGPDGDHPNEWGLPGGKIEDGETPVEAAIRETHEEAGYYLAETEPEYWTRQIREEDGRAVDFTTYRLKIDKEFTPVLSNESSGYQWCDLDNPPQPLHPGCQISIDRFSMNEHKVALAIREGLLTSPQKYENVWLYDIRVTGTKAAYRDKVNEFVWRDPELYLNDAFLQRIQGLAIIWKHPKHNIMSQDEFRKQIIGSVYIPYIQNDDVWCIARIWDDRAGQIMRDWQLSTSPAVLYRGVPSGERHKLPTGAILLEEGDPTFVDHLAICVQGVWDKGEEPTGIRSVDAEEFQDELKGKVMADEEKKTEDKMDKKDEMEGKTEKTEKKDAKHDDGEKLDKVLAGLDSMAKHFDAMESWRDGVDKFMQDSRSGSKKDSKKDEEGEKPEKPLNEEGKAKEIVADKKDAKKDDDEMMDESEKKKEEEAHADALKINKELLGELKDLKSKYAALEGRIPKYLSGEERQELTDIQVKADAALTAFGKRALGPLQDETPLLYARRMARELQPFSKQWKDIDLRTLGEDVFKQVEAQIYADAALSARQPDLSADSEPREIKHRDSTGREISTFVGSTPHSWLNPHHKIRTAVGNYSRKGDL